MLCGMVEVMSSFNWGIMASGKIAEKFAEALNFTEGARLYAVASRSLEKARDFANKHGAEKAYGSYEELAKDSAVDIIYIATPMSCHYDNVKLCFEHGKNVLCEKTITLNADELEELIKTAKSKNLFFMEAMWMKCMPHFKKALHWHKNGRIGEVKAIRADHSNAVAYDRDDRLFRNDLGGGALLDICVYPITFAASFLGFEPKEIMSAVHIGGENVDMNEAIIMKYENAFASMFAGFDVLNDNRAVIVGTQGRIEFNPWFFCTDTVRLYGKNGALTEEYTFPHPCNGYEYEITEAQDCLRDGLKESRLIPLSDTLAVLKLMDKIRQTWGLTFSGENES
ncbi:MAG: Gfo/Idh/MocA family oxidoreductase [Oscillospiraceae bacterium]|nr:Gfo/Idh/MocA family oxidoreductase [Oscillospiraceae bacterium]